MDEEGVFQGVGRLLVAGGLAGSCGCVVSTVNWQELRARGRHASCKAGLQASPIKRQQSILLAGPCRMKGKAISLYQLSMKKILQGDCSYRFSTRATVSINGAIAMSAEVIGS